MYVCNDYCVGQSSRNKALFIYLFIYIYKAGCRASTTICHYFLQCAPFMSPKQNRLTWPCCEATICEVHQLPVAGRGVLLWSLCLPVCYFIPAIVALLESFNEQFLKDSLYERLSPACVICNNVFLSTHFFLMLALFVFDLLRWALLVIRSAPPSHAHTAIVPAPLC